MNQKLLAIFVYSIWGVFWFISNYSEVQACSQVRSKPFHFFFSYQDPFQQSGGYSRSLTEVKSFDIEGCNRASFRKFIVLQLSPLFTDLRGREFGSAYGEYLDDGCKIINSQLPLKTYVESTFPQFYKQQKEILQSCLQLRVTDKENPIAFPDQQFDCKIEKIDNNTAIARGGTCYFQIGKDSLYNVEPEVNPDCLRRDFWVARKIMPVEIKHLINVFLANKSNGTDIETKYLGVIDSRVTALPGSDLVKLSLIEGPDRPAWPVVAGGQVELGDIQLGTEIAEIGAVEGSSAASDLNPNIALRIPFLVNNVCQSNCKQGICFSPCAFNFPAVAQISLQKKVGASYKTVDTWYQGKVVPPGFIGMVTLEKQLPRDYFTPGSDWIVTAKFNSLGLDWRQMRENMKQMLIELGSYAANGSSELGELPALGELGTLGELIDLPELPSVVIGGTDANGQLLDQAIKKLQELISSQDSWPPYYEQICHASGHCVNANTQYAVAQLRFTLGPKQKSGIYELQNLAHRQKSPVWGNYELPLAQAPQISCPQ